MLQHFVQAIQILFGVDFHKPHIQVAVDGAQILSDLSALLAVQADDQLEQDVLHAHDALRSFLNFAFFYEFGGRIAETDGAVEQHEHQLLARRGVNLRL